MPDCPFYEAKRERLKTREIRGREPPAVSIATIEWCEHPKHSPCSERMARKTIGRALTCDGQRAKCPLTAEQFMDVA